MIEGGCWPTHEQELLLRAALLRGPRSTEAFAEWERVVGFDHPDEGSYRMLPLVGRNLQTHCVDHPMIGRLRGIHRRAWCDYQMLLRDMEPVLRGFQAAGIDGMLLKGAALVLRYYRDAGLRPMRDIDILVPEVQAASAVEMLRDSGWQVRTAWPGKLTEPFRRFRHALGMEHTSGRQLDLHWHVLHECCWKGADDDFWAASAPSELRGIPLRTLGAADEFLLACAHGVAWNEIAPIRWIPDALTILRESSEFDWDRVVRQTERCGVTLPMRDALHYLASAMEAPIPGDVLRAVDSLPAGRVQKLEYDRTLRPRDLQKPLDTWRVVYQRYRRSAETRNPLDFATFLQYYWEVEHPWHLARMAGRWGWWRLRHLAQGGTNRRGNVA